MRTAVVRVNVDPAGQLTSEELTSGAAALRELVEAIGAAVMDTDVVGMPARRRQVQLLIGGNDPGHVEKLGIELCAKAFGTAPVAGVTTYLSRGTDDDAHGVLAAFGISGEIRWSVGADGLDVVSVTVPEADLQRVPESRIRTALEAALNYEVHIHTS